MTIPDDQNQNHKNMIRNKLFNGGIKCMHKIGKRHCFKESRSITKLRKTPKKYDDNYRKYDKKI